MGSFASDVRPEPLSLSLSDYGGASIMTRHYPDRPFVAVGTIVVRDGRVLLAQRGKEPSYGLWSLPGGAVDLVHGTADQLIATSHSESIYGALGGLKEIWFVEGARHARSIRHVKREYSERLTRFFSQRLTPDGILISGISSWILS